MTDWTNEGRLDPRSTRASRAALLGLLLWARYPFALILAGAAYAVLVWGLT